MFKKKTSMEVIRVDINSQYSVFHPGQLVDGRVTVQLRENIKARAVILHVVGKAKSSWVVWENEKKIDSRVRSRKSVRYSAEVVYVDLQMNLWQGPSDNQVLPAGIHAFPFTFTIPLHCPPSFEGTIGFIRYYLKAKIDRPWKFDDTTKASFTVMPHFDLNTVFQAAIPAIRHVSENIGVLCFKRGRIGAKISIPKCGFVPGENIPIDVEITNSTTKNVKKIETSLIEIVTYFARRCHLSLPIGVSLQRHQGVERKVESRTVVERAGDFFVAPNSQSTYQWVMPVPPIVPSFNVCPIIQVDYKLKVRIVANGTLNNSVSTDIPILIGTIPIYNLQPYPSLQQSPPLLQFQDTSKYGESKQEPGQDYIIPPQPSTTPAENPLPNLPPLCYAESIFGKGTVQEENEEKVIGFAPKYVFYNNV